MNSILSSFFSGVVAGAVGSPTGPASNKLGIEKKTHEVATPKFNAHRTSDEIIYKTSKVTRMAKVEIHFHDSSAFVKAETNTNTGNGNITTNVPPPAPPPSSSKDAK